MIDPKAFELLKCFRVSADEHIYQLGCSASLLNVHAQQKRAFNLVWALLHGLERDRFPQDVGIVGGGISALTTATALIKLGAKVHIYERMRGLMHLQQGNSTRFLHPNTALWPNELFGYPVTHLPFMNWRSGSAGDVAEQLTRQWVECLRIAAEAKQLEIFTNTEVTLVESAGKKISVRFNDFAEDLKIIEPAEIHSARLQGMLTEIEETAPKEKCLNHDAVIIASGYGLETPRFSVTPSYWRNDDFSQPILGTKTVKRFLVSGTGDGGLIDTLRLTIRDFQHQRFIQEVMYDVDLRNLGRELQKQLHDASDEKATEIWNNFIHNETIHVGTWPAKVKLEHKLAQFIRDDTLVVLNSKRTCPFLTESQLLHKILVAMLIRQRRIRHTSGDLIEVYRSAKTGEFVALIAKNGNNAKEPHYERVDVIVERHNAAATLPKLFGERGLKLLESLRTSSREYKDGDPTIKDLPIGFLANEYQRDHFERGYELGVCISDRDPMRIALEFLDELEAAEQLKSWNRVDQIEIGAFTFQLVDHTFFAPNKHSHSGPPIQNFDGTLETRRRCLSISTSSRERLEQALDKDFEYHYYKVFVEDRAREFEIEPGVHGKHEVRPYCWLINNTAEIEPHIEIQCWNSAGTPSGGMYSAHKFLRVPKMLEILGNRWPRTKLDGLGWALCLNRKILHDASRAYELLEWDNHFAWWLAVLKK